MVSARIRDIVPAGLAIVLAITCFGIATTPVTLPLSSSAVVQVWSDVARDVDSIGLSLTRIAPADEQLIGDAIALDVERWRGAADPRLQAYVSGVGEQLVAGLDDHQITYRFRVIDSSSEINAFAIPGGHVYITTGLIKELRSEAELAAVLGHEISHVSLKHCIGRLQYERAAARIVGNDVAAIVGLANRLILASYNAGQETDADLNGMLLAAKAGYDPRAAVYALEILARLEADGPIASQTAAGELSGSIHNTIASLARSHPSATQRIADAKAMVARNATGWRGKIFYIGVSNLAGRISRIAAPYSNELTKFDE
jgi:predicted Zn-dependent protease